jgi:hypothetical protein
MRVLVDDVEYPTIKKAMESLSVSYKKLLKEHKVERLYFSGYWKEVDTEDLKNLGRTLRNKKLQQAFKNQYCFLDDE